MKKTNTILLSIAFYLCSLSFGKLYDYFPYIPFLTRLFELLIPALTVIGFVLMIMSIIGERDD